jgi:hypothetical protein
MDGLDRSSETAGGRNKDPRTDGSEKLRVMSVPKPRDFRGSPVESDPTCCPSYVSPNVIISENLCTLSARLAHLSFRDPTLLFLRDFTWQTTVAESCSNPESKSEDRQCG